jgi:hypothetical protein
VPAQDSAPDGAPKILAAVAAVMQQVTYVPKAGQYDDGKRSGGTKYAFRRFEDTAAALGQAFRDHGVFVQSRVVSRERSEDKKPYKEGSGYTMWTSVWLTMEYTFTSLVDGTTLTVGSIGEGKDSSDKSSAKAMTMAMKSALTQAFMIATDDPDPDSERPGDFAQPVGGGQDYQRAQSEARQRRQAEQRGDTTGAPDGSMTPEKRIEFSDWVGRQLNDPELTVARINQVYAYSAQRGMLGFEVGNLPLEKHIRARLGNFGIDPNAAMPAGGAQ